MNRSRYFSIVFLLAILILSTCAQRGGNNPVGVTGGSDGGYGYSRDYYRESSSFQGDDNIYGVWADNNATVTLNTDGTFEIKSDEKTSVGTYSTLENTLTLNFEEGFSATYEYSLTEDRLVLKDIE